MISMIIAAALAAQPAMVPANPPAHQMPMMPMMQMGQQGHDEHGQMADMKGCCCQDMMSKMHEGHGGMNHSGSEGHSGE